jgi:enoyl-CoA hydratase/carnithine racemase
MTNPDLHFERQGDQDEIAVIRLARPVKRNALNDALILALRDLFEHLPTGEGGVRAAVITGEGEHFCAGLDLSELKERDAGEGLHHSRMWHAALERVQYGPVPVIAALQGAVVGGGLELASACHIRVADDSTFYALPEGSRGIFVGGGGAVRIQRLCGYARMADMMLTGRVLSAREGERANLCQYVVPAGQAMDKARELAAAIATNAPNTNWAICAGLPRLNDMGHGDGLFFEGLIGGGARNTEGASRIAAFIERGENKVAAPPRAPADDEGEDG